MTLSLSEYVESTKSPSVIREEILVESIVDNLAVFFKRISQQRQVDKPLLNTLIARTQKTSPQKRELLKKKIVLTFWEKLSKLGGPTAKLSSVISVASAAIAILNDPAIADSSVPVGVLPTISTISGTLAVIAFILWLSGYSIAKLQNPDSKEAKGLW